MFLPRRSRSAAVLGYDRCGQKKISRDLLSDFFVEIPRNLPAAHSRHTINRDGELPQPKHQAWQQLVQAKSERALKSLLG